MDPIGPVKLTAVVSKRQIVLNRLDVPTLFVVVGQDTAAAAWDIITQVRAVRDDPATLQVATIVDLRQVPRLLRKMGEKALEARYQQRAEALEPGQDPAQRVIIMPDFDGKALDAFGLSDVGKQLAVAMVAPGGRAIGVYQGDDPASAAIDLVAKALA